MGVLMPTLRTVTADLVGGPLDGEEAEIAAGLDTLYLTAPDKATAVYAADERECFEGERVTYRFVGYV
jgi:hypothetical protein